MGQMSNEEAARILDPETSWEALRECGSNYMEVIVAVKEAFTTAAKVLREPQAVRLDDAGAQALTLAAEVSKLRQELAEAEKRLEMAHAELEAARKAQLENQARAKKMEEIASDLCDDFTDFVTGGVHNAAPYCTNFRPECVNAYGWCNGDNSVCRGFLPKAAGIKEGG